MKNSSVYDRLMKILDKSQILTDEPMKNHTSFRIGGLADFIVMPNGAEQISAIVKEFHDVPLFVMGNGSNMLVSDNGIRGIVIKICENMKDISLEGNILTCQSGALLSSIASYALKNSLGGFEFASGIPGTVGGAVVMNAGAYDGEMKDVVISTVYIDENGDVHEITGDAHEFGYRKSIFSGKRWIIIENRLKLFEKPRDEIKAKMQEFAKLRRDKQPLECYSAGSIFKRPEGYYAGKLIEDAGLRGFRIGGACVSQKHCGFIVNDRNASFDDVASLIRHVQNAVEDKFGVKLETEVKICGL
ncbi:MAG: UDP-N-acetylenolpyruvoylglucosamine reductase [Firmicutes bacterium ADurb.Bin193]|nr:MAG: UDP-N-acetylenolpyruvoylglucosamine reductase [Firmicutes bacterium ADurb.Bin193]